MGGVLQSRATLLLQERTPRRAARCQTTTQASQSSQSSQSSQKKTPLQTNGGKPALKPIKFFRQTRQTPPPAPAILPMPCIPSHSLPPVAMLPIAFIALLPSPSDALASSPPRYKPPCKTRQIATPQPNQSIITPALSILHPSIHPSVRTLHTSTH